MVRQLVTQLLLTAVLIGLLPPGLLSASNGGGGVQPFKMPETIPESLHRESLQTAEGPIFDVNLDTETVRIGSIDAGLIDVRYDDRTQVNDSEQALAGCLEQPNQRRARIHFRTVEGRRIAVRIELLANRAGAE
jgi:hypothetical protein